MKSYDFIEEKYIDEIQSKVTVYRHKKSGARICTMENQDTNKVFSIAFRTPPINDCGLTHILEHSVLCGSKEFPIKDPFVELLKSSLNTFLNAFTYPDKTMYPCASQNDKDFKNLMHIYLDAVFYPQIYQHKEIFEQEGWHYHLENKEDPITINGVVYNEMKGAYSDPQESLVSQIMQAMYPDTAYHYESGGNPKYIPELSYEVFKDFHSKFYHPSNSYILIYGDCDMNERLEWLDAHYLSKFDAIDFDTRISLQAPFEAPRKKEVFYGIGKGEEKKDKTFLTYNVTFPTTLDVKLCIATKLLVSTLFGVPGAPVKQKLIDAKIGQDVFAYYDDGLLQPLLLIVAANANKEDEEKFISIIDTEIESIIQNGLDKDALLALLNHAEFAARERAFSARAPQGLSVEMSIMQSWLYDDTKPFLKIEILDIFRELKSELETGYFEEILKKYVLKNNHKAYVTLSPSDTLNEEKEQELIQKLEEYKASLSEEELDAMIEETKHLSDYQNEKDTEEALNTLPKLSLEDINPLPEAYNLEVIDGVLFSDYPTNDIAYTKLYFDISHLNEEDLLYTSLFSDLLLQLSTSSKSYKEINQEIQNSYGTLRCDLSPMTHYTTKEAKLFLCFSVSALTENIQPAFDLLQELITDTQFKDEKRLYEYLCEMKSDLNMSVVQRGHGVALTRAASYIDECARINDNLSGIGYIDFISELVDSFQEKKNIIIEKLYSLAKSLISKENYILGFTGSKTQLEELKPVFEEFYQNLPEHTSFTTETFVPNVRNEAFTAPFDVNFVSRVGKHSKEYHGGLQVLCNAMSMDYLWMQVRVHGGAYGCMMNTDTTGMITFTSYRDPNIESTNQVYQNSKDFVSSLEPTDEQLLKYIIGAIGSSDSVKHVRDKAETARVLYLRGVSYDIRKKNRSQLIHVTKEELKSFSVLFQEAMNDYVICTIGNQDKINENKDMFKTIRPLIK